MTTTKELTKEEEYLAFLETPRTTNDFKNRFDSKENAVWQVLRTLRLRGLVMRSNGFWKITEDNDNIPPIQITPLQREVLEYLCNPHKTTELMEEFTKSYQSAIQLIRTLRLMELVESAGRCSHPNGRCFDWKTTAKGLKALGIA